MNLTKLKELVNSTMWHATTNSVHSKKLIWELVEEIEKLRNEVVFLESELRDARIPATPSDSYFTGGKL